ncbi:hypothetical protein PILCRDRAFT_813100 [Piloderma croceum F 1598]|uniref:Uncharacterized protein n=1 Tax=Piloderma croceum (strain F 1598) TaxID=765440 RepID=A0A0C3BRR4_PILCF|nr:hypothetical protein PILCRDRAFT_813100 [Piloderma croceum F 1598]
MFKKIRIRQIDITDAVRWIDPRGVVSTRLVPSASRLACESRSRPYIMASASRRIPLFECAPRICHTTAVP